MIRAMKWILLLSTLAGAIHAGAQATIAGYTTLDYDAQSNTMIATCTSNRSYSATAYYDLRVNCTLSPDDTTVTYLSSPYGDGSFEFTPVDNVTYQAIGDYGASFTDYIKKALPNPGGGTYLLYEYYDPFDFSNDSDPGFEYPPYEEVWDGEGSQAEYVIPEFVDFGEVPSNPVATPQCFAQLKYRSIVLGEAVHTFWYIQAYNTTLNQTAQYIVDGGPSGTCGIGALYGCGFLNSGVTSGVAPFGSTFQTGDTTAVGNWWSTGATGAACPGAGSVLSTGLYWTQNSVTYQILGPNSNTFAGDAAINAGFDVAPWNVTPPPTAVGWP